MFGKYEISLAEATQVKNFLFKRKFITSPNAKFFGNLLERDYEKEFALDFSKNYEESIKLGPTGPSPSQYNTQRNFANFGKAHLKISLEKNKHIVIELTVTYAFSTLESGSSGVNREGVLLYPASIPIEQFFKI